MNWLKISKRNSKGTRKENQNGIKPSSRTIGWRPVERVRTNQEISKDQEGLRRRFRD